ncbi:MAG TPA: hypothetical protein VJR92_08645 [Gemmatimonadaceae bacterium]|nr:hypothetical protein [Gemmatimonadaceae bacterium]
MMRVRRRTVVAVVAAALHGSTMACTQVGADPSAVVAVAFDSLPYPAVIIGDSLRDAAGVATALRATGINTDGDEIPGAVFTFLALDAGATISAERFLTSTGTDAVGVRLIAQAPSGLQSRDILVHVTPRPDSTAQDGTVDTLRYVVPDELANVSQAIALKVLSTATAPPPVARGWIVKFQIEYAGAPVPPTSTTLAWLIDETGRRSAEDTTGTDGRVSRRLRVVPTGLTAAADSLIVTATVERYGTPLIGSPVRIAVHVRPQS